MSVLVTNASGAKGLVVTRSLGKKNIDVINTDSERFSASFFSRYSKNYFLTPSAVKYPDKYIEVILDYIKNNNIELLMPVNSVETLLISKYKDTFAQHTILPFEDYSKMIKLHDKGKLSEVAEELNIPIPRTYNIKDLEEIEGLSNRLRFPVVIKLRNSTSSKGIEYVYSKKEFVLKYKEIVSKFNLASSNYPLVQEYISGQGYGVSLLMNHGDLRAIFAHRRLREYPITGGPSTLRESVRHPEMEEIAIKLMEYFDWYGVAMVEFKLNKYTNKPVLIEVNPRFWGSLNQAIYSGVNFPFLLYNMAVEGDVKPVLEYKVGVKTRILMNDLRSVINQFKYSDNRIQTITETLKAGGIHDDIISFTDPLPSILFTYTNIKKSLTEKENYE